MIGWVTDNPLSRTVIESIPGIKVRHIRGFDPLIGMGGVFYGILRGCSNAMKVCGYAGTDYCYIDNGYFDALYVNKDKQKSMQGKFRVVKNGMHEVYPHAGEAAHPLNILVLPPSPYSANFYDTTPEDWLQEVTSMLFKMGCTVRIRTKAADASLEDDLIRCDGVLAFNSMAVLRAVEMGRPVADTHGIFRKGIVFHKHNIDDLRAFYEPKQFTLQEFKEGKCKFT